MVYREIHLRGKFIALLCLFMIRHEPVGVVSCFIRLFLVTGLVKIIMDSVVSENVPKKRSSSKMRAEAEDHDGENSKPPETCVKPENSGRSYVTGDGWNIALLLFLYLLQGIPLGLSAAIPIILQNRKVSYKDQVRSYLLCNI